MERTDAGPDLVGLVTRRFEVLDRLDDAVVDKTTLVEELDLSRSTVHRALRELESAGLVTRSGDGYTASASGRLAARSFREFRGSLDVLREAGTLLAALPPSAPMRIDALRGASVRLSEPPMPYRPIDEVTELIAAAAEYRVLAPAVTTPKSVDRLAEATLEGPLRSEVVCSDAVADYLRSSYPEVVRGAEAAGVDLYETEELPFGLAIVTDGDAERVAIAVYGPDGELRGTITNDTRAAVEWAATVFERYREPATPLRPA